ncbi:MAG: tRNA lysidine(34) synthetase TilS, partial [Candidatus Krumholzibacteria bacterium]|nr:tRNA lysidine(34) synthetase TilS [Candidatus Krumholzibacteria bacterium]
MIAAVSGGPDSMALLVILNDLACNMRFSLAAAHFNHKIRPGAEREKALVERYALALNVPLLLGAGDVPAEARKKKKGTEETARLLRYDFLEKAAKKWNADVVALGHTKDDQIETILHHIIRGTGWRGITGMAVKRGIFIRPLLTCTRNELKGFLRRRRVRYALDESNRDNRLLRNRIRNRLLPYLRKNFNPSIDESIIRLQENLKEGWKALEQQVKYITTGKDKNGSVIFPLSKIDSLSDFQLYLLIDLILRERFGVVQDVEKSHFDAAKRLIRTGRSGGRLDFPHGVTLLKNQLEVRLIDKGKIESQPCSHDEVIIPGPGSYPLLQWNLTVDIRIAKPKSTSARSSAREALLASVNFPVRVRTRKPGDRMIPFGMKGRKKLSDLFIDRKVPIQSRDMIPVFEDASGIFWVPGVATDERTRIGLSAQRAI